MPNVLFVSSDPVFGTQFTTNVPTGYSYVHWTPTTNPNTVLSATKYDAIFVYWPTPTGTTATFNPTNFIETVRNTTGYGNTPLFLVVPTYYTTEAPTWAATAGATGYVTWDTTSTTTNAVTTTNTTWWTTVTDTLTTYLSKAA